MFLKELFSQSYKTSGLFCKMTAFRLPFQVHIEASQSTPYFSRITESMTILRLATYADVVMPETAFNYSCHVISVDALECTSTPDVVLYGDFS